jgi:hypothetical protein
MKSLKAICAATTLALSLSIPAYAEDTPGEGHTPGRPSTTATDTGAPTTTPVNLGSIDTAPPIDGDSTFPTLADILWALASIY